MVINTNYPGIYTETIDNEEWYVLDESIVCDDDIEIIVPRLKVRGHIKAGKGLYGNLKLKAHVITVTGNCFKVNEFEARSVVANKIVCRRLVTNRLKADIIEAEFVQANEAIVVQTMHVPEMKIFGFPTEKYLLVYTGKYVVVIVDNHMKIGCKRYLIEEWKNFPDNVIDGMDLESLEWWGRWKEPLLQLANTLPPLLGGGV